MRACPKGIQGDKNTGAHNMAKTNYTKVDAAADQGLRKMEIDRLFEGTPSKSKDKVPLSAEEKSKQKLLETLKRDIQYLDPKRHKQLYTTLGYKRQDLKVLIENPSTLSLEDWEKIKQIKADIEKYRKEVMAQLPSQNDEKIVEDQRVKHINKRYNVNDKWLPLH